MFISMSSIHWLKKYKKLVALTQTTRAKLKKANNLYRKIIVLVQYSYKILLNFKAPKIDKSSIMSNFMYFEALQDFKLLPKWGLNVFLSYPFIRGPSFNSRVKEKQW